MAESILHMRPPARLQEGIRGNAIESRMTVEDYWQTECVLDGR